MVTSMQKRHNNFRKCSNKINASSKMQNTYHILRDLKYWGYQLWNTIGNMPTWFRSAKFCMILTKQTGKNYSKWHLIHQQGGIPWFFFKKRCRLNLRSNYFSQRVIDQWNGLPINLVTLPSFNAFKSRLKRFWKDHASESRAACYFTEEEARQGNN